LNSTLFELAHNLNLTLRMICMWLKFPKTHLCRSFLEVNLFTFLSDLGYFWIQRLQLQVHQKSGPAMVRPARPLTTALVLHWCNKNYGQTEVKFKFELVSNLIYVGAMCPLCSVQQTDQTWHFQIKYKSDNVSDHFYTKIKVPCVIHSWFKSKIMNWFAHRCSKVLVKLKCGPFQLTHWKFEWLVASVHGHLVTAVLVVGLASDKFTDSLEDLFDELNLYENCCTEPILLPIVLWQHYDFWFTLINCSFLLQFSVNWRAPALIPGCMEFVHYCHINCKCVNYEFGPSNFVHLQGTSAPGNDL